MTQREMWLGLLKHFCFFYCFDTDQSSCVKMHAQTHKQSLLQKNVQFLLKFLILTNDIDFFFQQEVIDLTRSGNG